MRRPPLAVVLAVCAVAGAALGAGGAVQLRGGAVAPEAASGLPVIARLPPSVLERPQRPADLASVPPTPGLRRSTLRRVGPFDADSILLVGLDAAGGRCVVAVTPATGLFRAGCVPEAAFAEGGARVAWSVPAGRRHVAAEWDADGSVRAGSSRRDQ